MVRVRCERRCSVFAALAALSSFQHDDEIPCSSPVCTALSRCLQMPSVVEHSGAFRLSAV